MKSCEALHRGTDGDAEQASAREGPAVP
jgi:hypothetical protein